MATLCLEDREVLAYLSSPSAPPTAPLPEPQCYHHDEPKPPQRPRGGFSLACGDHPPQFNCDCFRCYTSYKVRWGSSPNWELIHKIIDAFEDELLLSKTKGGTTKTLKKERRKQRSVSSNESGELKWPELTSGKDESVGDSESVQGHESSGGGSGGGEGEGGENVSSSEKE